MSNFTAIKYVVEKFNAREWDEVRNSESVRESVSLDVFKLRNFTMEQLTQLIIQDSHGKNSNSSFSHRIHHIAMFDVVRPHTSSITLTLHL